MTTRYIKIFSGSLIIVNRLKNLLDSHNIRSLIKNKFESARLAGFGEDINSVELFILNTDIEKSKSIVGSFKKEIDL